MGFSIDELQYMSIGQALDYMAEYVDNKSDKKETKSRKATQADFDAF